MAAKLKGNFFVLLRVAFNISITGHLIGAKTGGKEIQEDVRACLDTCLRLSSIDEVVSHRCKLRKTGDQN